MMKITKYSQFQEHSGTSKNTFENIIIIVTKVKAQDTTLTHSFFIRMK